MSQKDATISALIDSAITVFSERGYDGASLRDIAIHARAPLSTINLYFGNKAALFITVMHQVWSEIEEERGLLLTRSTVTHGGSPNLRDIITALVTPVVARARSAVIADQRAAHLIRQWIAAPARVRARLDSSRSTYQEAFVRWVGHVHNACPTLTKSEAAWGFSFVVGALYSWNILDHRYEEIISIEDEPLEVIIRHLVDFALNGLQGLIERAATRRRSVTARASRIRAPCDGVITVWSGQAISPVYQPTPVADSVDERPIFSLQPLALLR